MTMTEKRGAERINPYDDRREKGEQVEEMFDSIAPAYDFMNTAMTFGLHKRWRDRALKAALQAMPECARPEILDVATGTGDVAFRIHEFLPHAHVTGIDLSAGMLEVARKRLKSLPERDRRLMAFGKADCLALPFPDSRFDLITVAYGVRNFQDLEQGLKEMKRVLHPGGVLCIVELSCPTGAVAGLGYKVYTRHIIPGIGRLVSGDNRAYTYLPESIAAAPQRQDLADLLGKAGFRKTVWKSLTFGAVTYYLSK